ncbi:hypothetical protein [Sediminispirochaeta smaragdinae]|uniref:Uncharacterized protein n=1 Tax=Sediminispirochaeta smaragdinae (strain DSM 11293 / JCM 15392 / SEBR 4228) TaxID=573413 RepID=E1R7U8_SEDSS|nr:hypothetical protein [Sediminispirochaeta smaragdinae]ADK82803.1 hypothetical protein Spirs_3717 [Sediminispirochaeta smaragdinae DSM 11293]
MNHPLFSSADKDGGWFVRQSRLTSGVRLLDAMDQMASKDAQRGKHRPPKAKPLSQEEVGKAVDKLRRTYDSIIVGYMLSPRLKSGFEDRYLQALRARIDMKNFLAAEMQALKELSADCEQRRIADENRRLADSGNGVDRKRVAAKREDFADRILRRLREKMDIYPGIGLRWDESYDLDRLYGAMRQFESEYWASIAKVFRRIYPSRYSGPLVELERNLFEFTGYGGDGFPPRLYAYNNLENRFPRDERQLGQESMRAMLDASFFLHELEAALRDLEQEGSVDGKERKQVESAAEFVHTILSNFRLQDLKRRKE